MAYDPASLTQYFSVAIHLTGFTWRISDRDLTLTDGTEIEGLLLDMTPLSRSAGSLQDPRVILPSLTLSVDNTADAQTGERAQDHLVNYEFANALTVLSVGSSLDPADWQDEFDGRVRFPGGTSSDNLTLTIRVNDARAKDGRSLPAAVFDTDTYPNLEAKAVGLPIPILYGDFYSTAGAGETVPCYQIDSTVPTGGRFKISSRELKSIEAVYVSGVSQSFTADLNNGNFVLNVAYTSATDVVTAHCRGCTDDGTSAGNLLQSAPDVLADLLENEMDVDPANIDGTAFSAWEAELDSDDYVRRWIGGTIVHTDTLTSELLSECFAGMRIEDGAYYPSYRIVNPAASLTTFREADLLSRSGNSAVKQFAVHDSPDEIYCNEGAATYGLDPTTGEYNGLYTYSDNAAIARVGQRVRRNMTFNWLYKPAGVQARIQLEVFAFSSNIAIVDLGLDASALTLGPASQLRLAYDRFEEDADGDGVPMGVLNINTDYMRRQVAALVWDMTALMSGTWTEDASVTWLTGTTTQRTTKGFWTDDSGYADTSMSPDATSQRYRYAA